MRRKKLLCIFFAALLLFSCCLPISTEVSAAKKKITEGQRFSVSATTGQITLKMKKKAYQTGAFGNVSQRYHL